VVESLKRLSQRWKNSAPSVQRAAITTNSNRRLRAENWWRAAKAWRGKASRSSSLPRLCSRLRYDLSACAASWRNFATGACGSGVTASAKNLSSVTMPLATHWYIATFKAKTTSRKALPRFSRTCILCGRTRYQLPEARLRCRGTGRYTDSLGVMHHTTRENWRLAHRNGEAHGPYRPMKSMYYLYVPNSDAVYHRAIAAGATSIHEPADSPTATASAP